jgi:hypothetical protein
VLKCSKIPTNKLHNKELHGIYIQMKRSARWLRHVANIADQKRAQNFDCESQKIRPIGKKKPLRVDRNLKLML